LLNYSGRDACPTIKKTSPSLCLSLDSRFRGNDRRRNGNDKRKKIKVGSLAIMAILVTNYFRPITLRPIFSDSLPFSTFSKAAYSFLFILFPNLEGFRQDCKKYFKYFFID